MNILIWAIPLAVFVGTIFMGLLLAPYLIHKEDKVTYDKLQRENEQLKSGLPNIEIGEAVEYDNAKLPHSTIQLLNGTPFSDYGDTVRLYRIPIHNSGGAAPEVSVKLIRITPPPEEFASAILHIHDDYPKDATSFQKSFRLDRDATVYIDVIALRSNPPYECYIVNVAFQHAKKKSGLNGSYTFTIGVYAGNFAKTRDYTVYVDTINGKLTMS